MKQQTISLLLYSNVAEYKKKRFAPYFSLILLQLWPNEGPLAKDIIQQFRPYGKRGMTCIEFGLIQK